MKTLVHATIPYALIWGEGQLEIRIETMIYGVMFKRKPSEESDPKAIAAKGSAQVLEIRHDRLARSANTFVEIIFPSLLLSNAEIEEKARAVLNRLIEVYRFATNEFYLAPVPRNEMQQYTIFIVNDDGVIKPMTPFQATWILGDGLTAPRIAQIPDFAREILRSGNQLPIHRILYLNARREEVFENYRIAVVEAETAFEVLVDEVVSKCYRTQGHSARDVDAKLQAGFENLLKDHLPKACGEPFTGTKAHSDWKNDLYILRNAVIHDGASVTSDQTKKALDVAERALSWLEERILVGNTNIEN